MAAEKNETAAAASQRELVITRIFDAPRALVYQAWTDPTHLSQWLVPHGFRSLHNQGELRCGGAWRSCMRSPRGDDLWLGGTYREVIENELLMFTHAWDDAEGKPGHETLVTVRLEDHRGKTRMTFRQAFFTSVAERDGHSGGWGECFDRLAEHLAT